jgi:uncharacterized protein DUF3106
MLSRLHSGTAQLNPGGYERYSQLQSLAVDFTYRQSKQRGPTERTAHIMKRHLPSRLCLAVALCVLLASGPAFARGFGQGAAQRAAANRQQRTAQRAQARSAQNNPARPAPYSNPNPEARPAAHPGNLAQWMQDHKNLSLPDQQRALENEPGFRQLPAETQQRMLDRLGQLNNMEPQQRARILDRNEALERLTPQQREQYGNASNALKSAPPERQRPMARAILDLTEMPPGQREQVIDSPAFRSQFSDSERSTIRTLLMGEPYSGDR